MPTIPPAPELMRYCRCFKPIGFLGRRSVSYCVGYGAGCVLAFTPAATFIVEPPFMSCAHAAAGPEGPARELAERPCRRRILVDQGPGRVARTPPLAAASTSQCVNVT